MKTLVDITQKRNVAVMIVTHDENVVKYGTAKYYMEDGKRVTGWKNIEDKYYYFNENGIRQTGWIQV